MQICIVDNDHSEDEAWLIAKMASRAHGLPKTLKMFMEIPEAGAEPSISGYSLAEEARLENLRSIAKEHNLHPIAQDIHLFGNENRYQYGITVYESGANGSVTQLKPKRKEVYDSVKIKGRKRTRQVKNQERKENRIAAKGCDTDIKKINITSELCIYIGHKVEEKLKKKFPHITEAETSRGLNDLDYAVALAPFVVHYMHGKARWNKHKRIATILKDRNIRIGKDINGVDRMSRSDRRLLLEMKKIDTRKVDNTRWIWVTYTTRHDLNVPSYIPLANQQFKFFQSFLGQDLFGFTKVEWEDDKRHLHQIFQVGNDATDTLPITEDEREIWEELGNDHWASLVAEHTDCHGKPGLAIKNSQDLDLLDGDNPYSRLISYVTKKANYVRDLHEQGKHDHADRVEKKCDLKPWQLKKLNDIRGSKEVKTYLDKTGKKEFQHPHMDFAKVKKPGEHQYTVHNRGAAKACHTVEEIILDKEEYFAILQAVVDRCNNVLGSKGSKTRIEPKPYAVGMTFTMLSHEEIYRIIKETKIKVAHKRKVARDTTRQQV